MDKTQPIHIPMTPVESSAIKAMGHDPLTNTLRVEFLSGGTYDYAGVDAVKHAALAAGTPAGIGLTGASIGKAFHQHVLRPGHKHTRIG